MYYELGTLNHASSTWGVLRKYRQMNEWMTLPQMLLLDAIAEATEKRDLSVLSTQLIPNQKASYSH